MIWIPIAAWALAVVVAAVVLGFAAYEITWKASRLRSDVARLLALRASVDAVSRDVSVVVQRLTRLGVQ